MIVRRSYGFVHWRLPRFAIIGAERSQTVSGNERAERRERGSAG
ncbi:hypothetical protein [Paenibacillus rhizophilus]|nr:hypothetical protein [Paenibacillus rhizophilus]